MLTRRTFLQALVATSYISVGRLPHAGMLVGNAVSKSVNKVPLGFQGFPKSDSGSLYFAGNGTRTYNAKIARFNQVDSYDYSPFGFGGVNSYLFSSSDPINLRDPSGHAILLSMVLGAITGAIVGATISALSEGIKIAVKGGTFNWLNFGMSSALGALSGFMGATSIIAPAKAKVGLALIDSVFAGAAEFTVDFTVGKSSAKDAAISSATGVLVGLGGFGIGMFGGISASKTSAKIKHRRARYTALKNIERKTYLYNKGTPPISRELFDEQVSKGFIKVHNIPKGSEHLIHDLARDRVGDRFIFAYSERHGVRIIERLKKTERGFNPEAFHHQNIFRFSQDILSIGEMFFENGTPYFFANSGHYLPPPYSLEHVRRFFNKSGIDVVIPSWEDSFV